MMLSLAYQYHCTLNIIVKLDTMSLSDATDVYSCCKAMRTLSNEIEHWVTGSNAD
jgi:hypothetical protein